MKLRKDISKQIFEIKKLITYDKLEEAIEKSIILAQRSETSDYFHLQKIHQLSRAFSILEDDDNPSKLIGENYETEKNRIVFGLLHILDELERNDKKIENVRYNVVIGRAVVQLLELTKGTDYQNQGLIISSRYFRLEKEFEENIVKKHELEKLKEDVGLIYSYFT